MKDFKLKLLNETYGKIIDIGLVDNGCAEDLENLIANDFHACGITGDETTRSLKELYELVKSKREQTVGLEYSWDIQPFDRRISENWNY